MKKNSNKTFLFDYNLAFRSNLGWLSPLDQQILRSKKIAIAGMGGVGGLYLLSLVRLGVEHFHIADMDIFECHNFNRQFGANVKSLNLPKVTVLESMAKEINPNVTITLFPNGVTAENVNSFLDEVDIYVDALDVYVLDIRQTVFALCSSKSIPAITLAPLGMGCSYLIFMPGKMTFEQYFQLDNLSEKKKWIKFILGLNPTLSNKRYLKAPEYIDINQKKSSSTVMACEICAGVMGVEVLKILLSRGCIKAAPYYHYFDPYLEKHHIGKLRWGNRGFLQLIKGFILEKFLDKNNINLPIEKQLSCDWDIYKIINQARWAPSAENSQPWRFKFINKHTVEIHCIIERDIFPETLYDFNFIFNFISYGCLLKNIELLANQLNYTIEWQLLFTDQHIIKVQLISMQNSITTDLAYFIPHRSVDRNDYQSVPLTQLMRHRLEQSLDSQFQVEWYDKKTQRFKLAQITALCTKIRAITPELQPLNQKVFDIQHNTYSKSGVPTKSLGLNNVTRRIYEWSLKKLSRSRVLAEYLGGSIISRMELDYKTAMFSSAFFLIKSNQSFDFKNTDNLIKLGSNLQNFWLTATKLGLVAHPNIAPTLYSFCLNNNLKFSNEPKIDRILIDLKKKMMVCGIDDGLLLGRIGYAKTKDRARSIRMDLDDLLVK